ncbi:MAG: TIGR03557 family F420-dependent LLM class oxidoreductase [Jatrophihabitans sp.]|uniref:TIGR03557 family F420-dependent LLM class oxidoreductase n=1 Tax=Jatrophihabitans sp. TaxID=1932789 RepID=UPI003F7E044F
MEIGYFLSCEEYGPHDLIEQAKLAEQAGFDALWISDHFHPWTDTQGESPLVWSMIGAVSQVCSLPISTAVTCPTVRQHPAIVAQAAATSAVLTNGRFRLGVGTGEALNEHITGQRWPDADVRLEMLEEAVDVIRRLWTGEFVHHDGKHYTVEKARLYTLPDEPPPIYVSGFGPKAIEVAGRIGDGFMSTSPSADDIAAFRKAGGEGKVTEVGYKVTWSEDDDAAIDAAYRTWPNSELPGELSQVLPSPKHFEQASELVTRDMIKDSIAYGNDVDRHIEAFTPFAEAGFDRIYISQMGGREQATHYRGFFDFYGGTVLPKLRDAAGR